MVTPLSLSNRPFEHPAMDFDFLRREGIKVIERLAGVAWTDYNLHDPGITVLEQICYALTDLAYRTAYEVPDLLAESGSDPYACLFDAATILTTHPVTSTDMRKLAVDVPGVRNAWIERVETSQPALFFHGEKQELSLRKEGNPRFLETVSLKGLYKVYIEKSNLFDRNSDELVRAVRKQLIAHRNLCEDFVSVQVLDKAKIGIRARIEIGSSVDADNLLLSIYQRIYDYCSPAARFYSLNEMIAAGKSADDIFDGPRLAKGFIDNAELAESRRRTEVRVSDLISEIMSTDGVRAVRTIQLSAEGEVNATAERRENWIVKLADGKSPVLDIENSRFVLERDGYEVNLNRDRVRMLFEQWLVQNNYSPAASAMQLPTGRDRGVGRYYSTQHQFPDVYGVNSNGLPDHASPTRQAQAKQFKAYLMFFDQMLANQFAQLAHVKELFSFGPGSDTTYFSAMIEDASLGLDFRQPAADGTTADRVRKGEAEAHRSALQRLVEGGKATENSVRPETKRKSRSLDHLLARFAEQMTDYALLYGAEEAAENGEDTSVRNKKAFLRHYPGIGAARGTAFDYLAPESPDNRSGPERRVRYKLGIHAAEEAFYVVEHILLRPMAGDHSQLTPLLAGMQCKDPYSLRLSYVFPLWPARFQNAGFRQLVERTVREETPAHLAVHVDGLERDSLSSFEAAYREWLRRLREFGN
ncbi:MAG: hypothetical protein ACU84J_06245 [Gammaproteobacteria bacterium]